MVKIYTGKYSKCTKQWKQSTVIKQLLETLCLAIKMCTGFTADGICMNTMCAVSHLYGERVSKSCLMGELCFHHFVHFDCFLIYIFSSHHKQCASNQKDFTFMKFTSQFFSSADETVISLNQEPIRKE